MNTDAPIQTPEPIQNAGDLAAAFVNAIIPPGMEMKVTPPDVYQAHIFKTEICDRLRGFGFDPRFWQDGLIKPGSARTSKQLWTLRKVQSYLVGKGAIVAMTGDRGVGKTTICAQIAIERLWEDWHSMFGKPGAPVTRRITSYRKMSQIVSKFKALYADYGSVDIDRLERSRDHLCGAMRNSSGGLVGGGVDLLIIDELNEVAEDSKHKDRILTDVLDRRYSRGVDTVLITNQPAEEFERTINPSILSRLNEHGAIVPCEWQSFRDNT